MRQYDQRNLLIHAGNSPDPEVIVEVTPDKAGWDTIQFQVRRLEANKTWTFSTGENELALVVLSGRLEVESSRGKWSGIGQRGSVFSGLPSALYLPIHTDFSVKAEVDSEFAVTWTAADKEYAPRLVTPADIRTEIRGGDHATRQINSILPPGFPCARLVVVEVYTPGGNWSSYPPHKHDIHKMADNGQILEADLDEIYYYKIDRPEGYAFQRVYTDPESPLAQAGLAVDAALMPRNNDVVLIPEGYHPVSSPPGYTTYYLNVLAGSAQSLAAMDDPDFAWVKESYETRDPRVPIYKVNNPV
jgi:5-deoxy-glucuronate isomerase